MRWASSLSRDVDTERALDEAARGILRDLAEDGADLVVAFVSPHHQAAYPRVPSLLRRAFPRSTLLGCSAGGIIGAGREVEEAPGVSLTAAHLPGVTISPIRVASDTLPDVPADPPPAWLLLADPFTFDAESFVHALDTSFPRSVSIGGLASAGRHPGDNSLFLDDAVHLNGLVGVALGGNVTVDTIVAQGCRPIGQPMFVTRCERNVLHEIDGRRTIVVMQALHDTLSPRDRELLRHSLFLGVVMDESRQEYTHGDFLIRNVLGIDPQHGSLVVGTTLHQGQVVQFHLRDARTSAEDLTTLLARYRERPAGSLLFSCLGRGQHLYGQADHDTEAFRAAVGDVPLGGFFCNGEIGPVRGRTFLHGYTSAFGLFRPRAPH
jgi:small ligand-binding sensory domain FIST